MSKSYVEKLKDPRWQQKRLEILSRDEWMCQICCEKTRTLHVHHLYYLRNTEPWDHPSELLTTLCDICHEEESRNTPHAIEHLRCELARARFFADAINKVGDMILEFCAGDNHPEELCDALIALGHPRFFRSLVEAYSRFKTTTSHAEVVLIENDGQARRVVA